MSESEKEKDPAPGSPGHIGAGDRLEDTEWVEWWCRVPPHGSGRIESALDKSLGPIPFLRRGCSWACWVREPDMIGS